MSFFPSKMVPKRFIVFSRELKQETFLSQGQRLEVNCFPNLSTHFHIYVVKYLFTSRDDKSENLVETTVLACELFTSGSHSWLKIVPCPSST